MTHQYEKHENCTKPNCHICDGGLLHCTVCNGAEGTLTKDCPGFRLSEKVHELVYRGTLQFQDGKWSTKDSAVYTNCLDCPGHEVINDPDPNDWFCDDDKAVICHLKANDAVAPGSKYLSDQNPYKVVEPSIRPYNVRKEASCPEWCPLNQITA